MKEEKVTCVVIVQRYYEGNTTPSIEVVFIFYREISTLEFKTLYPSYRDDIVDIEYPIPGE